MDDEEDEESPSEKSTSSNLFVKSLNFSELALNFDGRSASSMIPKPKSS